MNALIVAFWLMLPAYVPNNCAALFGGGTPLDRGRLFKDGRRILGDGKTFRGTIAGTVCGVSVGLLQNQIAPQLGLPAFGDGYEQRVPIGLNSDQRRWEVVFANRPNATADAIEAFLRARGAVQSFNWTPPHGEERTFWASR